MSIKIEAYVISCSQKGQSQDYVTRKSNVIRVVSYSDIKTMALASANESDSTDQKFTAGDIIYVKIIEM